ncbi:MAG TPA: LuxR C-terminal-related transcriptional regulator, partial [Bacillales bacterium]
TAIDLALKAGDDVRAGSLILRFAPDLLKHAQWEDAQRWIGLLGRVEGKQKARMMLFYCWMYFLKGAFAGLSEFVQETEKQIAACGLPSEYKGELMLLRSFTAFAIKDVEGAVDRIDEAVSLLADRTVYLDGEMRLNIAEAQTIRGTIGLRGRLSKVIHYLKHFKKHRSLAPETFAGYAHTVGAETAYEINRLDEARYSAEKAFKIAKKQENASMLVPAAIVFSQILRNYKSYREGYSVIREAGKWVNGNGRRWELMLIAQEVRLLLGQGRIREAERLFYEQILHAKDGQEGLHEFESLTYVRVLIAAKAFDQAELLLEQLLFEAESHDRFGTRIEILVLQAVVCQKVNRIQKGMEVLKEAIELAEEEGYTRTFLDEGQPIHILFERIGRGRSPYVRKLLDLFDETPQHSAVSVKLTKRERDVLSMMGDGFTNKEMAEEINVTIGTVKGYASTLFRKLGVRSRTHAVARGRELDLLNSQGKNA